MGMRIDLKSAIWRALASTAVFAQLVVVLAPLVEIRDSEGPVRVLAAGVTTPAAVTIGAERGQAPPHNATTCPACIAQSLHAQVESGLHLPTLMVAERAPFDRRTTVLPHHDPPATHRSRAPPLVS